MITVSTRARDNREFSGPSIASPGRLRNAATIILQTKQAKRLIEDRSGLNPWSFARRVRKIWTAAQIDNPYADWWLLRIEAAMSQARQSLRDQTREMTQILDALQGVRIELALSHQPTEVPFQFASPMANLAVFLVADFDVYVRTLLTAEHFGVLDREPSQKRLRDAVRIVRGALNSVNGFKDIEVNRRDVQVNAPNAQQAREAMGEIPADVASGQRRSRQAPEIRPKSAMAPAILAASSSPAEIDPDDPSGLHQAIYDAQQAAPISTVEAMLGSAWRGYVPGQTLKKKRKRHKPKAKPAEAGSIKLDGD